MNIFSLTSSLIVAFTCLLSSVNAQSIQYIESPVEYTYAPAVIHSSYEFAETQPVAWENSSPTFHNAAAIVSISNAISVEPNPIIVKDPAVPQNNASVAKPVTTPVVAQATFVAPVQMAAPVYSAPIEPYVATPQWQAPVCMSGG